MSTTRNTFKGPSLHSLSMANGVDDRTRENLKTNAFRELAAHWLSGIQAGATKRNLVGEERKFAKVHCRQWDPYEGPFAVPTYWNQNLGRGSDGDLLKRSTTIGQVYNERTARKNISAFPGDATNVTVSVLACTPVLTPPGGGFRRPGKIMAEQASEGCWRVEGERRVASLACQSASARLVHVPNPFAHTLVIRNQGLGVVGDYGWLATFFTDFALLGF
ncbi:hypothetical protein B0H14DRAFT_2567495 [Mycena olivaceomarginata]|nr:hypothetical protein B0H14DRAFT_2567495 [Mycena olivaceomarginata]